MRGTRAGFRMGIGPFSIYVPVRVVWPVLLVVALLLVATRCAHAGSAPVGAPTFAGCINFTAGQCHDGSGGGIVAGGYYDLGHIVSVNGYVYTCATLNASGMCSGTVGLTQWSSVVGATWLYRDRLYIAARIDGTTFAALPSTGMIFDSAQYAAGGQWVIDASADTLEVLWCLAGLLLVVIFAVAWTRSGT